jgi:hypothetical protein
MWLGREILFTFYVTLHFAVAQMLQTSGYSGLQLGMVPYSNCLKKP